MRFLLLIFLFLCCSELHAKITPPGEVVETVGLKSDTTQIVWRRFDGEQLRAYSKEKAFIYDDAVPSQSLWNRFWRWFWALLEHILGNKATVPFVKFFFIMASTGLVVFVVLKLIGADLKIFSRRSKSIEVPYSESDDNIHEINFTEEIDKAISLGNYRIAVRLLYLKSLKKLSDSGQIDWKPGKTNQIYIGEIQDLEKRKQFTLLTHQFEYIWYGEFFINKDNFGLIKQGFDQFIGKAL
ncbi:hypothetical protein [Pedobacter nutrimenti]|uniref:hypothetical protein n=1 Tax=Pedobacter nutrimenti TaxID=1241337 RepID=UPI00292E45C7|nr:hypothetical protein [Pedobacter nutrimenti]